MYADLNDDILLHKTSEGDDRAFQVLYERHREKVYMMAFYTLRNSSEAEDIVQDVFLRLWTNRTNLIINSSFKGYLITTARNKSLNLLKSKGNLSKYLQHVALEPTAQMPSKKLENNDIKNRVNEALATIDSANLRKAFTLVHMHGIGYEETSHHLGVSIEASRNYVSKVVKHLRTRLKNFY